MKRAFLLLLGLAGCFAPRSGDYTFDPVGDATTTCEGDPGEASPFGVEIEVDDDRRGMDVSGTTYVGQLPVAYEMTCALDGRDVDCAGESDPIDARAFGYDVVAQFGYAFDGAWTSNRTIDGTLAIDFACTGEDCASFGLSDCSTSQGFEGRRD
jgi:hypothetical protein